MTEQQRNDRERLLPQIEFRSAADNSWNFAFSGLWRLAKEGVALFIHLVTLIVHDGALRYRCALFLAPPCSESKAFLVAVHGFVPLLFARR